MEKAAITFHNISKSFPGVKALDEVSFEVYQGEVHALLGENGAGKSTLLNILHGVYSQYEGSFFVNGMEAGFSSTGKAIEAGIAKVHQEIHLVNELTVAQNITLGYEPVKRGLIDYRAMNLQVAKILESLGCRFKSSDPVKMLSAGEMQMVGIAKALFHKASIISFDEPTTALTSKETKQLFQIIARLRNDGITILYVSHKLDEVFEIADRATVLRDGKLIGTYQIADLSKEKLIRLMVGRDVNSYAVRLSPSCVRDNEEVLVVDKLNSPAFKNVSFTLRRGEILGFAGLVGSGRTEVMRCLFGADSVLSGEIRIHGERHRFKHPEQALRQGIGLLPENRKTQGFVRLMSNATNIGLASLRKFTRFFLLNHRAIRENCLKYMERINLTPPNPDYLTSNLSGGNQQKVVLSKWLSTGADILLFDEPTKGIDVGAKSEIYKLMENLVAEGKAIIMVSSELPEIIGMSDRVVVMHEGHVVTVLNRNELSEETILQHAMGEK